ncbi:MAG: GNAT family N-acetyltransferase [Spongiibacter marinus]|uniref:GNAT family N-acetyltransferase n=1 Tax=Spongiibacter marinus TaxID=354246 RepID=UPI002E89C885|nr:GNAT family N-acetyltransferase [Pseudomonadota bacterium]
MLELQFIDSIHRVAADEWNAVAGDDYPFLQHTFLAALEDSGATTAETGWLPQHLVIREGGVLCGLLPLYIKSHSYGEYVFDWAWADAYRRHGLEYYPKLLSAIPFTPATGPRLCLRDDLEADALYSVAVEQLQRRAEQLGASSAHILFPDVNDAERWQRAGLLQRVGPQYHWFNRGYQGFDDFLATFSSRKRKNLRKERRTVADQGLRLERLSGSDVSESQWRFFFHCYQMTYAKRSGHGGYLSEAFFQAIARSMADRLLLVLAYEGDVPVAAALNFQGADTLFGRYWGCIREYDFLHFEACYYQGIEHCIEQGLSKFDPGAQGEHKIQRGFEPITTYSQHWLADASFSDAVARFLHTEQRHIAEYLQEAAQALPFKQGE